MNELSNTSRCAAWLKALAEPNRLEILQLLVNGPKTVTALSENLGVEMAAASHHLQVLLHAGLVEMSKQGRFVVYRMNPSILLKSGPKHGFTLDFKCCRFHMEPEA